MFVLEKYYVYCLQNCPRENCFYIFSGCQGMQMNTKPLNFGTPTCNFANVETKSLAQSKKEILFVFNIYGNFLFFFIIASSLTLSHNTVFQQLHLRYI